MGNGMLRIDSLISLIGSINFRSKIPNPTNLDKSEDCNVPPRAARDSTLRYSLGRVTKGEFSTLAAGFKQSSHQIRHQSLHQRQHKSSHHFRRQLHHQPSHHFRHQFHQQPLHHNQSI